MDKYVEKQDLLWRPHSTTLQADAHQLVGRVHGNGQSSIVRDEQLIPAETSIANRIDQQALEDIRQQPFLDENQQEGLQVAPHLQEADQQQKNLNNSREIFRLQQDGSLSRPENQIDGQQKKLQVVSFVSVERPLAQRVLGGERNQYQDQNSLIGGAFSSSQNELDPLNRLPQQVPVIQEAISDFTVQPIIVGRRLYVIRSFVDTESCLQSLWDQSEQKPYRFGGNEDPFDPSYWQLSYLREGLSKHSSIYVSVDLNTINAELQSHLVQILCPEEEPVSLLVEKFQSISNSEAVPFFSCEQPIPLQHGHEAFDQELALIIQSIPAVSRREHPSEILNFQMLRLSQLLDETNQPLRALFINIWLIDWQIDWNHDADSILNDPDEEEFSLLHQDLNSQNDYY